MLERLFKKPEKSDIEKITEQYYANLPQWPGEDKAKPFQLYKTDVPGFYKQVRLRQD